jgi:anti-anti-sigma regulatory factor
MNTEMIKTNEAMVVTPCELSELVRGRDQGLLAKLAPLVRQHSVSLDMGRVNRIDAAGIAALILLYGSARDAGHGFTVSNASARVREMLALVGLDRILLSQNAVQHSPAEPCMEMHAA